MERRVYRTNTFLLVVVVGVGALMVLAGIAEFFYGLLYSQPIFALVFSLPSIALGGFIVLGMLTNRVVLYPNAIEVGCIFPFATRRMERGAIAAKVPMFNKIPTYVLIPTDRNEKNLTVGIVFSEDDYFRDWMRTIPTASAADLYRGSRRKK